MARAQELKPTEDEALVAALRRGDEAVFAALVRRHQRLMLTVAATYVGSPAVAEEVVQETWLAVLAGIDRFEARSSLKTWIFRILANRARTRGAREARSVPLCALDGDDGPSVDLDRFLPDDHARWPGHWSAQPRDWERLPEERVVTRETLAEIREAIAGLPERQREVLVLRDVAGWEAAEVCEHLGLSEGNQRVLLHRARTRVRELLERRVEGAER